MFDAAQEQLQKVFGVVMVELPVREKRTLKDKQSKKQSPLYVDGWFCQLTGTPHRSSNLGEPTD